MAVAVLLPMKFDFPNHNRVGAGVVRDGLGVVASDHTGHSLGKPRVYPQGLHIVPARTKRSGTLQLATLCGEQGGDSTPKAILTIHFWFGRSQSGPWRPSAEPASRFSW